MSGYLFKNKNKYIRLFQKTNFWKVENAGDISAQVNK